MKLSLRLGPCNTYLNYSRLFRKHPVYNTVVLWLTNRHYVRSKNHALKSKNDVSIQTKSTSSAKKKELRNSICISGGVASNCSMYGGDAGTAVAQWLRRCATN